MKDKKKNISLILAICMLVVAAAALTVAGIGGSRAALEYFTGTFAAHIEMYDIGVSLTEQSQSVSWRNYIHYTDANGYQNSQGQWDLNKGSLLTNMLAEGETFQFGKTYPEALGVTNSGTINEFVRVTVYKYWTDAEGKKDPTLDPRLIDIEWDNIGSDWIVAEENDETMVLYYNKLLYSGASTAPFTKNLTVYIDDTVKADYEVIREGNVLIYQYRYDGSIFQIEAEVDAVQEHNAADAILASWGVNAAISGDSLSISPY